MKKPAFPSPFAQVICAIAAGIVLGFADPALATSMKPLGDWFIRIIKLLVGPIIFFTVTSGIAALGNVRQIGRVGLKALVYFEVLSVLALMTGLAAAYLLQPGAGFHAGAISLPGTTSSEASRAAGGPALLPTLTGAFLHSGMLQILVLAVLCGVALALLGPRAGRVAAGCARAAIWMFRLVRLVLLAAPLAAFGAIAYTVGKYGFASVIPLLHLLGALYLTSIVFILIVLGVIAHLSGFRLLRFIAYIKDELMIVAGTSSSMTAMPRLIEKLEGAGCARPVVGVVVPAGYSFNLNGSNIYIAMALVFLAQALHIELRPGDYLTIIVVAMVTSKGASGVAGSAFIALAATLAAVPAIPAASLMFIVGIERMLKCRSLTNIIGNGVACMAIAAWEGRLDRVKLHDCGLDR